MAKTSDKPKSFEAALTELESIVAAMETPDLPLEQSLAHFERGTRLLRFCENALGDAEARIRILEGGQLEPFQAATTVKPDQ
ncbi:exodeoxyribonuclease VII small subunit [Niveibacterium sp. 24ML]|uniref:exodeoxyribonuclease VII small subunit n=1 Tax=Niveibacterium sp. 24ML TaxID=2985512 RepID=UPI002271F97C|nr:exodeoxyribonuclease VII small subunit [Niveibacterium sp. 24ML]MCX9156759.1 exodeoxyribonuclease VII small subunit [Niveibacterium sp. 24ML]